MKQVYRLWFWFSIFCLIVYGGIYVYKHYIRQPMISVVMSTYNRAEPALPSAIESVLNQTYENFEFIIIDDGSTDNTEDIIKKYARRDSRIRFFKNRKNKGLIFSLNRGLDAARGKYIARMDDDDASLPWRFERQLEALENNPDIIILGGGITSRDARLYPPMGKVRLKDPKRLEIETYFSSGLAHPTIMIRRDFLEKHHLRYSPQYLYAEDCGLYKDVLNLGGKLSAVEEPVLRFGFIQKQNKPNNYGGIQYETFKKIQAEKFRPFFEADKDFLGSHAGVFKKCVLLNKLSDANREKRILDQEMLERVVSETCPKNMEKAVLLKHPYWTDFIEIDGENVSRPNGDKAVILSNKDGKVTLKWEKWDVEIYQKTDDQNWVYFSDENGHVKKKDNNF